MEYQMQKQRYPYQMFVLSSSATRQNHQYRQILDQFAELNINLIQMGTTDIVVNSVIYDMKVVILLSQDGNSEEEFIQLWEEVTRSSYQQFVLVIDEIDITTLPRVFHKLDFYSLEDFELIKGIAEAVFADSNIDTSFLKLQIGPNLKTKTVPSSPSETFSIQLLRRAWVRIKKFSASTDAYFDELAFLRFEENLDSNLITLVHLLNSDAETYTLQPLTRISIEKSKDTPQDRRYLYQAQPETALVLQAICDSISSKLKSSSITQSYGNRVASEAQEEIFLDYWSLYQQYQNDILEFAGEHEDYFYHRVDVRRYYPRVNLEVLFSQLQEDIDDIRILNLIQQLLFELGAITHNGSHEPAVERGLPAGLPIAHVLANYHLHQIDTQMKEATKVAKDKYAYYRYVDDIVFFGRSSNDVENLRQKLESNLAKFLKLPPDERTPLHPTKSTEIPQRAIETANLKSSLRGISWHLERSFLPWLSQAEQVEIAETIYQHLFEVNDDPRLTDELSHYTPRGIGRLQELNYDEDAIEDLIYKLLEKISLRVNNINYLVSVLVDKFWSSSTAKFRNFIRNANVIVQLAFVQRIRVYVDDQIDPHLIELVTELIESENQFITREAAITLIKSSRLFEQNIPSNVLQSSLNKNGTFARAYLIELGVELYPDIFAKYLVDIISESISCMNSILVKLMERPRLAKQFNDFENIEPFSNSEVIVRFIDLLYFLELNNADLG